MSTNACMGRTRGGCPWVGHAQGRRELLLDIQQTALCSGLQVSSFALPQPQTNFLIGRSKVKDP